MLLVHRTDLAGLAGILRDGKIRSPTARGAPLPAWAGEASNYVFFSPTDDGDHLSAPLNKNTAMIVLDMESVMKAHPKFVINDVNNWGPSDGKPGKLGCKEHWTYNTVKDIDAPCVKKDYDEMMSVLEYNRTSDFPNNADGPEVAVLGEVDLKPHLQYIRVGADVSIPSEYEKYRRAGGRRKRTARKKRVRTSKSRKHVRRFRHT